MRKLIASPAGRLAALVVVLALALTSAQGAQAASLTAATAGSQQPVAHTKAGDLTSRLVGTTSRGQKVTGKFVPLNFSRRDGKVFVRGLVQGVVHRADGDKTTFAQLKTFRVKSINQTPVRTSRATSDSDRRVICDILHLVLGPLDLDLLGLRVHLDRVVLDIVAATGAGNLLGNLLCAVTGLLDGGLGGLLGRLVNLLNRILAILRLG
jgi:hypothetical protein